MTIEPKSYYKVLMDYDERERKREKQRLSLKQTHYIIKCPSEQYADVTVPQLSTAELFLAST